MVGVRPRRGLLVLLAGFALLPSGCGGTEGTVIAEGNNVAAFDLSDGHYVITKVEAFEAGKLKRFPGCDTCSGTTGQAHVIVMSLKVPERSGSGLIPSALAVECATRYPDDPTVYIAADRGGEGRCEYFAEQGEGEAKMGFQVGNPDTPLPKSLSLAVPGQLPISIGP